MDTMYQLLLSACVELTGDAIERVDNGDGTYRLDKIPVRAYNSMLSALAALREDDLELCAMRWRSLLHCARVHAMGSAGLDKENPEGYAHLAVAFWTHHEVPSKPYSLEWLTKFADKAMAVPNTLAQEEDHV